MYFIELINVTGRDQAGLTAMLTDRLAGANVMILDMGQAVIHDFLTLGLMIRCETGREESDRRSGSRLSRAWTCRVAHASG